MYGPCLSSIGGGHPLRSPKRHRLGRPLPYQLADTPQVAPEANYSFGRLIGDHIWDYLRFREAIPDFWVRPYVLLPRLPLCQYSALAADLRRLNAELRGKKFLLRFSAFVLRCPAVSAKH